MKILDFGGIGGMSITILKPGCILALLEVDIVRHL